MQNLLNSTVREVIQMSQGKSMLAAVLMLLLLGGCTAGLSPADRSAVDQALEAGRAAVLAAQQAEQAAERSQQAAQRAAGSAQQADNAAQRVADSVRQAEAASEQAQQSAVQATRAFELGLRK
jgi:multidrug resistance efflux pump